MHVLSLLFCQDSRQEEVRARQAELQERLGQLDKKYIDKDGKRNAIIVDLVEKSKEHVRFENKPSFCVFRLQFHCKCDFFHFSLAFFSLQNDKVKAVRDAMMAEKERNNNINSGNQECGGAISESNHDSGLLKQRYSDATMDRDAFFNSAEARLQQEVCFIGLGLSFLWKFSFFLHLIYSNHRITVDRLIVRLINCSLDWLIDALNHLVVHWLIDWLMGSIT